MTIYHSQIFKILPNYSNEWDPQNFLFYLRIDNLHQIHVIRFLSGTPEGGIHTETRNIRGLRILSNSEDE